LLLLLLLLQIDRLVSRAFRNLKADEVLNFSVAVTVMRVQRKWRARMRAAKLKRKREVKKSSRQLQLRE
jgi:hypothetical protein